LIRFKIGYGQRREFQIEDLMQKPSIKLYTTTVYT